jgi:hypothetical protein
MMADDDGRQLRARHADLAELVDRALRSGGGGTMRRLVQVYDGGMIPSAGDHFFLTNPVELNGLETEGGTAAPVVDTTQTIVVDVLNHPAVAGDLLTAYAVGGRWVAERFGTPGGGGAPCYPCTIPEMDLTLSWVNPLAGNGSTTLVYTPSPNIWRSGCVDGQIYTLLCQSGTIELAVTYFISGFCPTGQSQFCSNLRVYPFALVLSSYSCSPFSVTYTVSPGCPNVESPGYTSFTVTP